MKRVLLFFVMILLVLVSARSVFCMDELFNFSEVEEVRVSPERRRISAINRAAKEYKKLKMEADGLVSKDIDEASLQLVIRLLACEIKIVENILKNKTGVEVDELILKRDKFVRISTKTVSFIYKAIMDLATSDTIFNGRRKYPDSGSPLRGLEKKNYLSGIKTVLSSYKKEFCDKQYYLSQQTLCLPAERYNLYVAQNGAAPKKDLKTNIDVQDDMPDIAEEEPKKTVERQMTPPEREPRRYDEDRYADRRVRDERDSERRHDNRYAENRRRDRYDESRRDDRYEDRRYDDRRMAEIPRDRYHDARREDRYDDRYASRRDYDRYEQRRQDDRYDRGTRFLPRVETSFRPKTDLFSFQSELRNEVDDNVRSFGSKFMTMRDDFIAKMNGHEVVNMVDSVVSLVKDEIYNHAGSRQQREKMFHGGGSETNVNTHIDVVSDNPQVSRKAKILFGAITDTATKKTMELGGWNPDIYELNLRHYVSRFEYFKSDMERMIAQFKDDLKEKFFGDCKRFQASLDNLMNSLVYSISSAK